MKLKKLTIGILAAVAAFTLGISAYAAVGLALSFLPTATATSGVSERNIPKTEPVSAAPISTDPVLPSSEDVAVSEETPAEEFDPAGSYYLDQETVPKAFADIDHLKIETHLYSFDSNENPTVTLIAPKGSILTNKERKLDRIAIGGKEIAFQTATVDGVSYKFTGRFLTLAYCETDGDTPDLKGRLIKIKDNKWAAEMEAEFYVACGC